MLPGGEEWILRPVLRGMLKFETLYAAGDIGLEQIALLNDAIDAVDENERRFRSANNGR